MFFLYVVRIVKLKVIEEIKRVKVLVKMKFKDLLNNFFVFGVFIGIWLFKIVNVMKSVLNRIKLFIK